MWFQGRDVFQNEDMGVEFGNSSEFGKYQPLPFVWPRKTMNGWMLALCTLGVRGRVSCLEALLVAMQRLTQNLVTRLGSPSQAGRSNFPNREIHKLCSLLWPMFAYVTCKVPDLITTFVSEWIKSWKHEVSLVPKIGMRRQGFYSGSRHPSQVCIGVEMITWHSQCRDESVSKLPG